MHIIVSFWLLLGASTASAVIANDDAYETNEDVPLNVPAPGVLGNDNAQGGGELVVSGYTQPANGSVIVGSDGSFTYTPAADYFGTDSFEYEADNAGTVADTATVTITVHPVNDPPSFTAGPDQTVLEDAGAQSVPNWATNLSPGPANESDQTLTFIVTGNTNPGLFSAGPAVDGVTGELTFTPAPDANGSATIDLVVRDSGGTVNGGQDTSPPQSFTINVTPVNDAPSFSSGGNVTVNEDAGPQTISPWATNILAGPPDESGQTLTFNIVGNSNPALFSAAPAIDAATGDLTFTSAADEFGSADITVTLSDNGGTANGGQDTSAPETFTITVNPVNDAPSFTAGPDQEVFDDVGPQTVPAWATDLSPGPANESDQTLTFIVTSNSNPGLFSSQPAVNGTTGDLTYTPAANASGLATIDLVVQDNGGTANGGQDTSPPQTFTIAVNLASPVAADDARTMAEDSGPILINVMANDHLGREPTTLTSAGVDGYSESEPTTVLNQLGDAITLPNGTVTIVGSQVEYNPKQDFNGEDFFTYTITSADGISSTATVFVTVTPVNDPPVGIQQKDYLMQENGSLSVDAENGLLAGAYDVDGAVLDENGEPVGSTITVVMVTFPTVGSLSVNHATGAFQYTPPVDFTGSVEFEYRLSDGIDLSEGAPYRVAITVLEAPEAPEPPPPGEVAAIFNLANAPLEQTSTVPPNVLAVIDDSGSMDWNLLPAEGGQEGTFVLDNSSVASGNGARNTRYTYLWDLRNNAYPVTSVNGRVLATPEALEADSDTAGNEYGVWRARTYLHNVMYYNPEVEYTPWIGQDALNQEFGNANPSSVRLDPVNPSANDRDRINILEGHSYRSTRVPEWNASGGSTTVQVDDLYIPHYYLTSATPPLAWNDPHTKVEIRPGTGPLGGLFPGGPERDDCAVGDGNPLVCTYEQEIQNFANYFQYYRTREYVTKNGMGKTIAQLQDIRIGYLTISATTSEEIREMNALHTEGNKKALLDNIYRVDSFGGTPLRQALGRAGQIFECSTGQLECPVLPEPQGFCQQNFALLLSDGFWNGGTGITGNPDGDNNSPFDGGRYADNIPATLADVAMHYYETDLHPLLPNEVPVTRRDLDGVPSGVFTGADPKMHQHMKTYAIAFGITGTVNPADIPTNPAEPFAWPDPFSDELAKIDDMLHAAVNGRGRFLSAGNPRELQSSLESAFLEFTQAASSTSAAAFNSTSLQEGTLLYRGFYDLRDNTGELTATVVNPDGTLATEPEWRASERLNPAHKLPANRVIVSFDPDSGGIPFRHPLLTEDQQRTLNEDQVDFLRGIRAQEQPNGPLRERPVSNGLLGDIVNSSPVFVGTPRAINRDQRPYPIDDLYSEFVSDRSSRTPVVYVGANDGMLHGFNGLTGDELFAYVPNKLIDSSQGHKNSLDQFTSPFYQHRYFVDLSPRLNDVYMRGSRSGITKGWNTVLVGGLGVGGKGYFALNVTQPDTTFSSEAFATGAPLWEFTDEDDTYPVNNDGTPLGGSVGAITDPLGQPVKDLGYSVSTPVIAMSNVNDGGSPSRKEWVAVFGNGVNSTAGIAKLFVLFMDRGLNGWGPGDFVKLNTGFGVPSAPHPLAGFPNHLGTPAAVDTDLNGTVDRVYAGDRLGNLFRFDLSDADPNSWTVTRLFTATYDTGSGETIQPILTEPLVIRHPTERGFLVIFGTGSYVTRSDADSPDIQSIYAIWDEGGSSPATALDDTKELRLVEQTITNVMDGSLSPPTVRRIVSRNAVDYQQDAPGVPGTYGWYIDLDMVRADGDSTGREPPGAQFPGEKAIRKLLFRGGAIITTTVLPSLDEFSCFGTRPGSILVFDALTGGDARRPVIDFNNDGYIDNSDLVSFGGEEYAGGILFNQSDLDGQLVDLSTLGGEGDMDWLFVSGGNETRSYRIESVNDNRTGRLSWRELNLSN